MSTAPVLYIGKSTFHPSLNPPSLSPFFPASSPRLSGHDELLTVLVCCTESTSGTVLDPARYMNTTNPHTTILKTDGARVTAGDQTISRIYYADQAKPLGMIVVLGHAGT
jgi:hypothetical protein